MSFFEALQHDAIEELKWSGGDFYLHRSSPPVVLRKKRFLKFLKMHRKHLCQILFFNKLAGLRLLVIKKETLAQVFSSEFCEISKNNFLYRTPLDNYFCL